MRALASLGVSPVEVRHPGQLGSLAGLVMPGGESTTMTVLMESSGLTEPLRAALACGLPVLGTCAGMILLASGITGGRPVQRGLGAIDIDVRRNAFGAQVDSFETDLDVAGLDDPLHAVFIRAPVVVRVGPGVEVLARVGWPGDPAAAAAGPVACRQGPVLATAFHPELAGDTRLHRLFLETALPDPGVTRRDCHH